MYTFTAHLVLFLCLDTHEKSREKAKTEVGGPRLVLEWFNMMVGFAEPCRLRDFRVFRDENMMLAS